MTGQSPSPNQSNRMYRFYGNKSDSEHILLVDGLFDPSGAERQPLSVDEADIRCLCGANSADLADGSHSGKRVSAYEEAIWISLIPGDIDYIAGLTEWLEENQHPRLCYTCYVKATQMEKMAALGGCQ